MEKSEKKVLSKKLIFLDQKLTNQDEVIQLITKKAEEQGYVEAASDLYAAVKKREQAVPTAIGYDIAIPHGKSETVDYPFIAFLRTESEFRWTTENEELVRLVFLIGVPEESEGKLHLKFISKLSKKLLDESFREKLLVENDKNKIFEQLNSIEIEGGN